MAQPLAALDSAPTIAYHAALNYPTIDLFYNSQHWDYITSRPLHHWCKLS